MAEKRLSAIREFTEFGAGFKIALRDLEIRGAGNILGAEQHGHMMAVGYDIYTKLLEAAVNELKGKEQKEEVQPVIELEVSAYIDDKYIEDTSQKMEVYRRIASVDTVGEVDDLEEEVEDRFGDIPEATRNLLEVARIRVLAKALGISSVIGQGDVVHLKFQRVEDHTAQLMVKAKEIYQRQLLVPATNIPTVIFKVRGEGYRMLGKLRKFLEELQGLHEAAGVV
jgi:transcription-repair coupling factor (superfamily II helicase)